MKTHVLISTLVLSAFLGTAIVNADDSVLSEGDAVETGAMAATNGKGLVEGVKNVVKKTVGGIKKAIPISASTAPKVGDAEGDGVTNEPEKAVVEKAITEDDTKDAEANRKVSETSIAIYSQNPYIQSVMQDTTHIKSARLKELMARGDKVTMLDIRPRSEFAKTAGIKGVTLNIPRNFLEVEAYEKLSNKDASIIIISSKGIRGGLAANTLQQMGYTNVRNLMDGLEGWNKVK
jgi:rhodanese-related sulfurtransferase